MVGLVEGRLAVVGRGVGVGELVGMWCGGFHLVGLVGGCGGGGRGWGWMREARYGGVVSGGGGVLWGEVFLGSGLLCEGGWEVGCVCWGGLFRVFGGVGQ